MFLKPIFLNLKRGINMRTLNFKKIKEADTRLFRFIISKIIICSGNNYLHMTLKA